MSAKPSTAIVAGKSLALHNEDRRTFYEVPLTAVRQISTTTDRLHIRILVDGIPRGVPLRFAVDDLGVLERAIARAPDQTRMEHVAGILFDADGRIDVGVARGAVVLRVRFRNGKTVSHCRVEGAELEALHLAIQDLKNRSRPDAATRKE